MLNKQFCLFVVFVKITIIFLSKCYVYLLKHTSKIIMKHYFSTPEKFAWINLLWYHNHHQLRRRACRLLENKKIKNVNSNRNKQNTYNRISGNIWTWTYRKKAEKIYLHVCCYACYVEFLWLLCADTMWAQF